MPCCSAMHCCTRGRRTIFRRERGLLPKERRSTKSTTHAPNLGMAHRPSSAQACTRLAILTIHHWPDRAKGLRELLRTARRHVVLLTWDPSYGGFWLTDYFPEMLEIDRKILPSVEELGRALGRISVTNVPIPHDCSDGFLGAYWRRPSAYLDPRVRSAISTFSKLTDVETGLVRLGDDLQSGEWRRRYGNLLRRSSLDLGYRLVVSG